MASQHKEIFGAKIKSVEVISNQMKKSKVLYKSIRTVDSLPSSPSLILFHTHDLASPTFHSLIPMPTKTITKTTTTTMNSNDVPQCRCPAPSVRRVVRKNGPNQNRPFFTCAKPMGEQCGYFEWTDGPSKPRQPNTNSFPNATTTNKTGPGQTGVGGNKNGIGIGVSPNAKPQTSTTNNTPSKTRLTISLSDAAHITIPIHVTAPQAVKEAVAKFSRANSLVDIEPKTKSVFGENIATIPVENLAQFDTFLRSHAPGVTLDYTVPRALTDRLVKFHSDERKREERGDVVTCSLDELLPSRLSSSLMQFQWHGVHFALKRGGRCLIGDDMGLGKTIQAITIARVYMEDWPLLIVCPSSLRLNWKEEILRWLGDDVLEEDIRVYMTGKDAEKRLLRVNIASYDLIRKIPPSNLEQCQFIIADESHYLKSITAQRTKVVTPLVKSAKRALLLSGTPALSRPVELFAQVNAIAPALFPSYNDYVVRYCNARQTYWGFDVTGSSHLDELHMVLAGTVLIRRKKDDVLTQLPDKMRQVTWVETKASVMSSVSKKFKEFEDAKAAASDASSPEEATAMSMRVKGLQNELYALTAEAKLQSVLEFCKDTAEAGCKFIVFAHHSKMIDALDEYVKSKLKLGLIRIDGSTPQAERQALCNKFQDEKNNKCRVALLSITAAGVGLTLTKATVVLFAELYWNPGSLLQAEDRAHRIGQRNSILVTYLLAKKTLDESMWKTVRRKLTVVGQSLTGTASKMDAEEGKKTDIKGSSSSAAKGGDSEGGSDVVKSQKNRPFFPEKKSKKKGTKRKRAEEMDIDAENEVENVDNNVESAAVVTVEDGNKVDKMFPDNVVLDDDDGRKGTGKQSMIDADVALARRLQRQYDEEARRQQ